MKTVLPEALTNVAECEAFLQSLFDNEEFYHLDDPAEDIENIYTGMRIFTDEEAVKLNALMKQGFEVCDMWELPVLETILFKMWGI